MPRRAVAPRLRNYEYLDCRRGAQGHHRVRLGAYHFRDDETGERYVAIEYECSACGRTSTDFLDANGDVIWRRSHYPDGYVFKYEGDEERVTSTDVRVAVLAQTTIYGDRETMLAARAER